METDTSEAKPAERATLSPNVTDYLNSLAPEDFEVPDDVELLEATRPLGGPGRPKIVLKPYEPRGVNIMDSDLHCNEATTKPVSGYAHRAAEKTSDRIIGLLHAQGHSGLEIAAHLGLSKTTVYSVLRLPWVRELIREEIKKYNIDAAQQKLAASLLDNIDFLQDIVRDGDVQTRDRITAAKELLDRTLGKSTQLVKHQQDIDLEKLSDEALAEIATRGGSDMTIVMRDRTP